MLGEKFYDGNLFLSVHSKEEVYEKLRKYDFEVSIPEEMIEVYNGYNREINDIKNLLTG